MQVERLGLDGPLVLTPELRGDERGWFFESFNRAAFEAAAGASFDFVQDNHSMSRRGVLRGLHYQVPPAEQGKLVRAVAGEIFDVVVDIRRSSPTFGKWAGIALTASNRRQLWVPPGFAHGFLAVSPSAECLYKTTGAYAPQHERCIAWDDPAIGIAWPLDGAPSMSPRDASGAALGEADVFS
jgi:dTDP-4-dehydrorhamnose 3,5-epimerase